MSKKLKQLMAGEIRRGVTGTGSCVILGYKTLSGDASTALRAQLRKAKVELTVVRNRVAVHALAGTDIEGIRPLIKGPTAVATGGEDSVALAKAVVEGMKGRKGMECRGGFVEGRVVTGEQVKALARLPGRLETMAMIASAVQAPARNIAATLQEILSSVARTVDAVRNRKDEEAAAAPPPSGAN